MSSRRASGFGILVAVVVAASAHAQVVVNSDTGVRFAPCAGQDATLRGDGNTVSFSGACRSLRVDGNRNLVTVQLGRSATVRVTGDYNHIAYLPPGPPPPTTLRGYYNEVVPGTQTAAASTLLLDGSLGNRDVACGGLDVVIRESRARYVLHGGCRSLTVEGRDDAIAAELQPAARLVIGGTGVVVNYVLSAQGAPPSVVVTSPGARATHLARYGESGITLPTN